MKYWEYEDEFIQHDREQLIKQAWPITAEGEGRLIITGTPLGGNEFYKLWVTKTNNNEITTDNSNNPHTQEY